MSTTQQTTISQLPSESNFLPTPKEIITFMTTFLVIVFVFYINNIMAFKYFAMLALAVLAFSSRNKLLWFTVYFVIVDTVGGFFTESAVTSTRIGMPILSIVPGVVIGLKDLLLLSLVFSFSSGRKFNRITSEHVLILSLVAFAVMVGFIVYGANYKSVVTYILRGYLILLLFFVIKADFTSETLLKFFHMISLLLVFVLIDQVFTAITGTRLLQRYLGLDLKVAVYGSMETRSSPYGLNTVWFSFVYGLILLSIHNRSNIRIGSYFYGAFLVVASVTSVLLSATRGFIGVFAAILIVVSPYLVIRFRNFAITLGLFILILNILGLFGLGLDYFYRNTFSRIMMTVAPAIAGKGVSEIDTSGRNLEIPALIETIKGSPVFGYGISNRALMSENNNFGGVNTIIQFGLLGMVIILFIILRWTIQFYRELKYLPRQTVYFSIGHVGFAGLIGMLLGYFTTYNYFTSPLDYDIMRLTLMTAMSYFVFDYSRRKVYLQNSVN